MNNYSIITELIKSHKIIRTTYLYYANFLLSTCLLYVGTSIDLKYPIISLKMNHTFKLI